MKTKILLSIYLMTSLVMTATSITPQQACDAARKFVSHNVTLRNHAKHITI